jgi:DNA invertase Pin-like site-specific DNA recombinase
MKAIILARESDKNQDSNDAQLLNINNYIQHKTLTEWKVFKLKESSTKGTRKQFQEVIKLIESSAETIALVVDTVDRLQRSFKESVVFDELRKRGKVELHFLRENLIINKNSNSSEIIRWDIAVVFAKAYILQLQDNLKRKHNEMRENGEITSGPPLGYKSIYNDNPLRRRRIDVIPNEKATHIVKMFELYAAGNISVKSLCEKMYKLGLRTDLGEKVNQGLIFHYLNLTFYYGVAYSRTHKLSYPHKYKSLISKDLFDKCQDVMSGHNKVPAKYGGKEFVFKGIITCQKCGCVVARIPQQDECAGRGHF